MILYYLKYLFTARHSFGHGIHSPFVYNLVREVLMAAKRNDDLDAIKKQIKVLRKDHGLIPVQEMGGGSKVFGNGKRQVSKMLKTSSVSPKFGRVLYYLIKYCRPTTILELGTSIGVSTMYMAKAKEGAAMHSLEGNQSLIKIAKKNVELLGVEVDFVHGRFEDTLPKLLENHVPDFVFIDGNHTYEASMYHYNMLSSKMSRGILVFDDINWSGGMRKAWKEITHSSRCKASIDLFFIGIVILDPDITPGNYTIRY